MIESLLIHTKSMKKGIIMQECAGGHAEMTVYSLVHHCETKTESQDIEWRGIKSTIGDLIATSSGQRTCIVLQNRWERKGECELVQKLHWERRPAVPEESSNWAFGRRPFGKGTHWNIEGRYQGSSKKPLSAERPGGADHLWCAARGT